MSIPIVICVDKFNTSCWPIDDPQVMSEVNQLRINNGCTTLTDIDATHRFDDELCQVIGDQREIEGPSRGRWFAPFAVYKVCYIPKHMYELAYYHVRVPLCGHCGEDDQCEVLVIEDKNFEIYQLKKEIKILKQKLQKK